MQEGHFFYDLVYENYFTVKIASDTIFYGYDDGYKIQGILKPNIEYDMKYVPFLLKESLNTRSVDDINALKDIKDTCKMMYIKLVDKKIHDHKYHCYYFQCKINHDMPEWYVTKRIDVFIDTETLLPVQTDYIYEDRVTRVSVW